MELNQVLRLRRSTRAYLPEQISPEALKTILTAGALAPAAMGRFDKERFIVVQNAELLDSINSDFIANTGNRDAYPTYGAPTVIFVLGLEESDLELATANAACAIENMALAATELGLGSVYLYGVCKVLRHSAQTSAKLSIPHGFRLISALAVGQPAEPLAERTPDMEKIVTTLL